MPSNELSDRHRQTQMDTQFVSIRDFTIHLFNNVRTLLRLIPQEGRFVKQSKIIVNERTSNLLNSNEIM